MVALSISRGVLIPTFDPYVTDYKVLFRGDEAHQTTSLLLNMTVRTACSRFNSSSYETPAGQPPVQKVDLSDSTRVFTVVYADRTFKTVFKQQILTDDDFQVLGSGYTLTIPPAAGLDGLATAAVPPGAVPPVSFGAGAWSASHLKYMKNAPGVIASSYQHFATTMEHGMMLLKASCISRLCVQFHY